MILESKKEKAQAGEGAEGDEEGERISSRIPAGRGAQLGGAPSQDSEIVT